jgi:hypothetical protein
LDFDTEMRKRNRLQEVGIAHFIDKEDIDEMLFFGASQTCINEDNDIFRVHECECFRQGEPGGIKYLVANFL